MENTMNKRIKELIKQATEHDYTTWDSYNQKELVYYKFNQEKFAQLIVRECIDCLKPLSRNHSMVGAAQDTIREHFGVER